MPIHALNHVGLSSPDLPRLVAFYRDLLGFAEVVSFSWPVGNTAADEGLGLVDSAADVTILNAGNMYLELFCFHSPEPAPQALDRPVQDEGISHLCLEVSDTDLVLERLRAGGAVVDAEPVTVAGTIRIAAVRDPDGNVVELQQTLRAESPTWSGHLSAVATPAATDGDEQRVVEPAPGVLGVNHVGVSTRDLDAHTAFYRDAAGLAEVGRDGWDTTARDGDPATGGTGSKADHVLLHSGNVFLDLTEYAAPRGAALDPNRPINDHGLNHLCFDVSDIDDLHAAMVDGGMTFHRAPATMPAGLSAMGYARDPFGNALELIENRSPKAFMWCGHLRVRTHPSD